MTCTLATILACLQLSDFYVDASVIAADSGVERYAIVREHWLADRGDGVLERQSHIDQMGYERYAMNPYGRIALGFKVEFTPRCYGYAELAHHSSLATGRDRGNNSGALGARCSIDFIFGGGR